MKNTTPLATIVAITLMGTAIGHAQDEDAAKKQKQFNNFDADKSGSISLEEFKAKSNNPEKADKLFSRIDTDKNGSLSFEEFSARKPAKPKTAQPAPDATE